MLITDERGRERENQLYERWSRESHESQETIFRHIPAGNDICFLSSSADQSASSRTYYIPSKAEHYADFLYA